MKLCEALNILKSQGYKSVKDHNGRIFDIAFMLSNLDEIDDNLTYSFSCNVFEPLNSEGFRDVQTYWMGIDRKGE